MRVSWRWAGVGQPENPRFPRAPDMHPGVCGAERFCEDDEKLGDVFGSSFTQCLPMRATVWSPEHAERYLLSLADAAATKDAEEAKVDGEGR